MTANPMVAEGWNAYIGSVWSRFLHHSGLDCSAAVVEIGPGFADKIGLALADYGFRGTLYVVEPNRAARTWVEGRYRELLPKASIVTVGEPVARAAAALPAGVEALLLNHVLDDLVLGEILSAPARERVFGSMRPGRTDCPPEAKEAWSRLMDDPRRIDRVIRRVVEDIESLLGAVRPRLFGVGQYASSTLAQNGLLSADRLGARLLGELAARMGRMCEADRAALCSLDQDPGRWLWIAPRRPSSCLKPAS